MVGELKGLGGHLGAVTGLVSTLAAGLVAESLGPVHFTGITSVRPHLTTAFISWVMAVIDAPVRLG